MINDLVRYDGNVVVTREFTKIADRLRNFTLRDSDVWILTFPKCGTTWAQETVSMHTWKMTDMANMADMTDMKGDRKSGIYT